jgi:hypothetical protein
MTFGRHPLELDSDDTPITVFAGEVAQFTTPCHWSATNLCSAPACIERAYPDACEILDQFIAARLAAELEAA